MLNGLHFLVHPLHGEPLVLAALVAAAARGRPAFPAVGVVVAVLHGRESDDATNVEDAHGHAAPRDESQVFLIVFLVDKMVVALERNLRFLASFDRELSGLSGRAAQVTDPGSDLALFLLSNFASSTSSIDVY